MSERLTEQTVIEQGGWHPRYARVLVIQEVGAEDAVVVVDGNGDGAELELEHWLLTDAGWLSGSSQGIGPLDDDRRLLTSGWYGGAGYALGVAAAGETVAVEWDDQARQATANAFGVWSCIFPGLEEPEHRALAEVRRLAANSVNSGGFFVRGPAATIGPPFDVPRIAEHRHNEEPS